MDISKEGTLIRSRGPPVTNGRGIAISSIGFSEGIHKWFIECVSESPDKTRDVGVVTDTSFAIPKVDSDSVWFHRGNGPSYHFDGCMACLRYGSRDMAQKSIGKITPFSPSQKLKVTLDCEKWKIRFEKGKEGIECEIEKNRKYYPAIDFYCMDSLFCFKLTFE